MKNRRISAFSLLEMAIVVAIIGVLMGAVVSAQSFMRSAELADAAAEADSLAIAYNAFIEQYKAIPGDFTRARATWGARSVCPPAAGTAIDGTNTCDGNGDSELDIISDPHEAFYAFQHLALAQLIPGTFTGAPANSGVNVSAEPNVNVPAGPLENSGYLFRTILSGGGSLFLSGSVNFYDGRYGPVISFGGHQNNYFPFGPAIKPEEMYKWDQKVDDALPASGRVVSYKPAYASTPNCATNATSSARYNVTYDGLACVVLFKVNP